MTPSPADLSRQLVEQAESVCRHYLPNGRRSGNYWIVGDVYNTVGQSMFVRLKGVAAGRWTDAATGQFGDLIDLIRENRGLPRLADATSEACSFLGNASPVQREVRNAGGQAKDRRRSSAVVRRLVSQSLPVRGSMAELYLANRGIGDAAGLAALRFHPHCRYMPGAGQSPQVWPALIGLVTDLRGSLSGIQRTWLDPDGFDERRLGKAPVDTPRRALGALLGHAVGFGRADDTMAAGEGIETVLSVRNAIPGMSMLAALSANNLAALNFPAQLRRLYVLRDNDVAGRRAADTLLARAAACGIECLVLQPSLGDFNEDLRKDGVGALRNAVRDQLSDADAERFVPF